MIKNVLEVILVSMIAILNNFNLKIADVNDKLDKFYNEVHNGLYCYLDEEVYLRFNEEYLDDLLKDIFGEYKARIEKENETSIVIKVRVIEKFLNKEVKYRVYLKKGELYD